MAVIEIVVERISIVSGGPKDSWLLAIKALGKKWIIAGWQGADKERFEAMIDGFLTDLHDAPLAVRWAIEGLKEEELYEHVITVEEGEPEEVIIQPGGA